MIDLPITHFYPGEIGLTVSQALDLGYPVKEEEPKVEDKPSCDHVIGLDSTGYAYSPASLTIKVGETVCWQWTDSADLHNVAEISSEGDTQHLPNEFVFLVLFFLT